MLDPRFVAENLDTVRHALARRSAAAAADLDKVARVVEQRLELLQRTEARQAERNAASKEMAALAKGDPAEFAQRREVLKTVSTEVKVLEGQLAELEHELGELLMGVPNLPLDTVPSGGGEADNQVVRHFGEKPVFAFEPKAHWDLGEALGILDFERAAKISGARFSVLMGAGAKLERALAYFMLEMHTGEHGYTEVTPPLLVRGDAARGTGSLPKFEADLFKTRRHEDAGDEPLYLIPTAEVPVTNLHADEILSGEGLPLCYAAHTPCFRSEAGSYGKDVRGLIRQHQFEKVEIVRFAKPERSLEELELLTGHAEEVLKRLGLHYRVVALCAGDLGFSSCKTYDLEVWLPSQNAYREISSCSLFGDFQARRAKIRYRPDAKAKPEFVHTLNGSGVAIGRALVAVLENYQQADGSIIVPEVLRAYMGTEKISGR